MTRPYSGVYSNAALIAAQDRIRELEAALRDALTYIEKPEWRALVGFTAESCSAPSDKGEPHG